MRNSECCLGHSKRQVCGGLKFLKSCVRFTSEDGLFGEPRLTKELNGWGGGTELCICMMICQRQGEVMSCRSAELLGSLRGRHEVCLTLCCTGNGPGRESCSQETEAEGWTVFLTIHLAQRSQNSEEPRPLLILHHFLPPAILLQL